MVNTVDRAIRYNWNTVSNSLSNNWDSQASAEEDAFLTAGMLEVLKSAGSRWNTSTVGRRRKSFDELIEEHGSVFDRACRMSHASFVKLHDMLFANKAFTNKGPNGGIDTRLKLLVVLRHFAGGDPLNIVASHGVSHSTTLNIVWDVVDSVNRLTSW